MLEYDSILRHATELLLLAGLGAITGARSAVVATSYTGLLAAGAAPDSASMRNALLRGLNLSSIRQFPADGVHSQRAAPLGVSDYLFQIACAILMACLFVLLHRLSPHHHILHIIAVAIASAILLILALIDYRSHLLPDSLTLPLMWLGLLLAWSGHGVELTAAVAGAMMGYFFLWSLFWIFKGLTGHDGMGYGDFKLLAALGAWLGWRPLIAVLLVACFTGILFAMVRQKSLRPIGSYPFGPFLAAAGIAALLHGSEVHLYF